MSEVPPSETSQPRPQEHVNVHIDESLSPETQGLLLGVDQEGLDIIESHLPEALPQEPVAIFPFRTTSDIGGRYYGKLRGIHYYGINTEILHDPKQRPEAIREALHERLHQRHAELAGQEAYWGFDPDQAISDEEIAKCINIQEIAQLIANKTPRGESSLESTFTEGVAMNLERILMHLAAKDAAHSGDIAKAKAFINGQKQQSRELCYVKRMDRKGIRLDAHYERVKRTLDSRKMMAKLSIFGPRKLISMLKSVDLDACRKINIDTDEYVAIIKHPLFLPGINENTEFALS